MKPNQTFSLCFEVLVFFKIFLQDIKNLFKLKKIPFWSGAKRGERRRKRRRELGRMGKEGICPGNGRGEEEGRSIREMGEIPFFPPCSYCGYVVVVVDSRKKGKGRAAMCNQTCT